MNVCYHRLERRQLARPPPGSPASRDGPASAPLRRRHPARSAAGSRPLRGARRQNQRQVQPGPSGGSPIQRTPARSVSSGSDNRPAPLRAGRANGAVRRVGRGHRPAIAPSPPSPAGRAPARPDHDRPVAVVPVPGAARAHQPHERPEAAGQADADDHAGGGVQAARVVAAPQRPPAAPASQLAPAHLVPSRRPPGPPAHAPPRADPRPVRPPRRRSPRPTGHSPAHPSAARPPCGRSSSGVRGRGAGAPASLGEPVPGAGAAHTRHILQSTPRPQIWTPGHPSVRAISRLGTRAYTWNRNDRAPRAVRGANGGGNDGHGRPPAPKPDDAALVAAAQAGDDTAFAALVERHHPALLAYLRRQTDDPELAEDLAQDTFLAAFQDLDRLPPTAPSPPGSGASPATAWPASGGD